MRVQGYPWCKDEPKVIGLASAASKILCERHNNALSPVDEAGIAAFKVLQNVCQMENVRAGMKPRFWHVPRRRIDAGMLERWFVKTAINLACVQQASTVWAETKTEALNPPKGLVEAAFGSAPVPDHMGLYLAMSQGQGVQSIDRVSFIPIFRHQTETVGGFFEFRGFRFVLWLVTEALSRNPVFGDIVPDDWYPLELSRRQACHIMNRGGKLSQVIEFKWPRQPIGLVPDGI